MLKFLIIPILLIAFLKMLNHLTLMLIMKKYSRQGVNSIMVGQKFETPQNVRNDSFRVNVVEIINDKAIIVEISGKLYFKDTASFLRFLNASSMNKI